MLVYVWSRRNPYVRMNFFGLLNFQAPFLPWVLMGFSLLLGNSIIVDLLGKILGSTFSIILLTNLFCHTCHINSVWPSYIVTVGLFDSYMLKDYNVHFQLFHISITS